jgi:hypothetical protein
VFESELLKALSRHRRSISDAWIRIDMALFLPNGALTGAAVDSQTISKALVTRISVSRNGALAFEKKRHSAPLSATFLARPSTIVEWRVYIVSLIP